MTPSIAPAVLAPAVQLNGPLLNLSIPEEEQNTYIWWAVMCAICAANVAFLFHSRRVSPPRDAHERSMQLAATVFVLGCDTNATCSEHFDETSSELTVETREEYSNVIDKLVAFVRFATDR